MDVGIPESKRLKAAQKILSNVRWDELKVADRLEQHRAEQAKHFCHYLFSSKLQ